MATYNFYIRDIPASVGDPYARSHWSFTLDSFQYIFSNSNSYQNSGELFLLYPRFSILSPASTVNKTPDNTTTNLYEFRFDSIQFNVSSVYPFNLGFGIQQATTPFVVGGTVLRVSPTNDRSANIDNTTWIANNWTIGNTATFLSEITNFIAKCCDNSRLLTGNLIEPLSSYSDFNIQTYINGASLSGENYTIVIFYPGNDPEADQIITVNT
jgi:hypothetical protein